MFWNGERAFLDFDRGPWTDPVKYLQAIAHKEITWTQKYGKPMEPDFPHRALSLGLQQPDEYINSLKDYLTFTPHLVPHTKTHAFRQPTLRHPDLTPANIFIDPATSRVVSLIDWQHTIIQPQILAAGCPPTFENPEPTYGPKLTEAELHEDLSTLSAEEQADAQLLYRRQLLFYCYRILTSSLNKPHHVALRDRLLRIRHLLVDYAGREWCGNNVTLRGAIIRVLQHWDLMPDAEKSSCPIHIADDEIEKFDALEERWIMMSIALEDYRRRACDMNEDGSVRTEDYDDARKALREIEKEILVQCDGDADDERAFTTGWPFRDSDRRS